MNLLQDFRSEKFILGLVFPFILRLMVHNHDMCPNEWTMYTLKIKLAKIFRGGGQQFKPPPLAKRSRVTVLMVIFSVKRNHEHLRWCQFLCRLDLFIMGKYVHIWLLLLLTGLPLQSKPVTLWETKSDLIDHSSWLISVQVQRKQMWLGIEMRVFKFFFKGGPRDGSHTVIVMEKSTLTIGFPLPSSFIVLHASTQIVVL